MTNIRLKKGQVDPKNPHATSVTGAQTLKGTNIDSVQIEGRKKGSSSYHWDDRYYVANCPTCKEEYSKKTVAEMQVWEEAHDCVGEARELVESKTGTLQSGLYVKGVAYYHAACEDCGQQFQTKTIREMKTVGDFHECGEVDNSKFVDAVLVEDATDAEKGISQ